MWEAQVSFGLNGGRQQRDLNKGLDSRSMLLKKWHLGLEGTVRLNIWRWWRTSQKIKNLCDIFANIQPPSSPQNSSDFHLKKQVHVLWRDLMLLLTSNLSLSSYFTIICNDWFRNWLRYLSLWRTFFSDWQGDICFGNALEYENM